MKFFVTLKDPDGVYDAIQDAARESLLNVSGISDDEREALLDERAVALRDATSKWFEYGEYLTIQIDTDAGTATVRAKGVAE